MPCRRAALKSFILLHYCYFQQGANRIEEEEEICRRSRGEDCDMTIKNNIEAIIIKWAYQIDEVLSKDSAEELNVADEFPGPMTEIQFWKAKVNTGQTCSQII